MGRFARVGRSDQNPAQTAGPMSIWEVSPRTSWPSTRPSGSAGLSSRTAAPTSGSWIGWRARTSSRLLRILSVDQQAPTGEIVVLTSRSLSKRRLLDGSASDGLRLTDAWPTPRGQVYCTTIYDFKGLDRAVVILADIGRWPSEWDKMVEVLYVGCSRARNHLIVLLDQNAPPRVQGAFAVARERV